MDPNRSSSEAKSRPPRGRVVNPEVLQLHPQLLHVPLAAPWQRAGAMAVDLVVLGFLSLLTGPVLGLLTGVTLASLGRGNVSDSRFWRAFRWVLILLGAGVIVLSAFLLVGRPIVRTSAFNLAPVEEAPELRPVVVSPSASSADLRRAVSQLDKQVDLLRGENERLRESARGNSVLNAATDFSSTLGLTFGWAGVYFTLFTSWFKGRTPGKMLFRSRVVRLDGQPITPMDAFTRNGGYAAGLATGSLGFLRVLWDSNRQAIEDKIAGTVVISTRGGRPAVEGPEPAEEGDADNQSTS